MKLKMITGIVVSLLSITVFTASITDFEGRYRLVSESKEGVYAPQLNITSDVIR